MDGDCVTVRRYMNGIKIESNYFKNVEVKNKDFLILVGKAKNRVNTEEVKNISTKCACG